VLLVTVGVTGHKLAGYSTFAYAVMIGLALGPQLLGHTAFNWALRHVSATFVAISILGEPIGSALLALFLLGERFVPVQLVGFVLILGGIYLAARGERQGGESQDGPSRRERVSRKEPDSVKKQGRPH
jgi:drug/metabolite transporter (DMT)-like permease